MDPSTQGRGVRLWWAKSKLQETKGLLDSCFEKHFSRVWSKISQRDIGVQNDDLPEGVQNEDLPSNQIISLLSKSRSEAGTKNIIVVRKILIIGSRFRNCPC